MKNVFFALAFMLVSTFAFANNDVIVEKPTNTIENELTSVNKIDFNAFTKMLQNGNVVKIVKEDGSFLFLDDCGNWWSVTYSGMSGYQAFLTASEMIYDATGC